MFILSSCPCPPQVFIADMPLKPSNQSLPGGGRSSLPPLPSGGLEQCLQPPPPPPLLHWEAGRQLPRGSQHVVHGAGGGGKGEPGSLSGRLGLGSSTPNNELDPTRFQLVINV